LPGIVTPATHSPDRGKNGQRKETEMGADLLVNYVDTTEPKEHWDNIVTNISDRDIFECLRDTFVMWRYESEEYFQDYDNSGEYYEQPTQELFDALRRDILEGFELAYSEPRDSSTLHVGSRRVTLTAGLSWGDDPTDSYHSFGVVQEFQYWYENIYLKREVMA
jgi:hypothetical protein